MNKRAVIYARFSSHSQTEQSIEGQLRECYDYAKRHDLIIVDEYIDRALTGTTDKRPSFLKMIEDSRRKTFDFVLVYQLDRFARNRYDSANYKAKLKKNGVRVLSAKENISEDASGILIEGVLESMAEYYSAELSQKVKRGIKESLANGYYIGGPGLFGYDVVDKKWVVNTFEADIVRDIFRRYNNGEKLKEIIGRLNREGIKTKAGSAFNMNSLSRIIRNEKYIGIFTANGVSYDNIIPAILDVDLFRECNRKMDAHKHKQRECKTEKAYILSGKLFCGYCGSMMTAETGTSKTGVVHHYYKCFNRKLNPGACGKKNYKQKDLEDLVFKTTIEHVLKQGVINRIAEIVVERFNAELTKPANLVNLENELKTKEKALNSLLSALEQGIVTKTTKERMLALEAQKEELETKIALEKARQVEPLSLEMVKSFLYYFAHKKYETEEARNEFFNSFINRVILYDDRVLIFYNTDPNDPTKISIKDNADIIEKFSQIGAKENSLDPSGFKRVSLGGELGIRTPGSFHFNGFQDRRFRPLSQLSVWVR